MTKYIFNNEEYTSEQVQDAANQSGVDIDTYIKEAGLEMVSEEDFSVESENTFEVQEQPVEKPMAAAEITAPVAAEVVDTDLQLENGSSEPVNYNQYSQEDIDSLKVRFDQGNFKTNQSEAYLNYKQTGNLDTSLLPEKYSRPINPETNKPFTAMEWVKNSLANRDVMVEAARDFRAGEGAIDIMSASILRKLYGKENAEKMVAEDAKDGEIFWTGGMSEEELVKGIKRVEQLNEKRKETASIVEGFKEGDLAQTAAGIFNAATQVYSSLEYAAGTALTGWFTDFYAQNYININRAEAEKKGIDFENYVTSGEDNVVLPFATSYVQTALESFGARNIIGKETVKKATQKVAEKLVGKEAAELALKANSAKLAKETVLGTARKEAGTEIGQSAAEIYSETLAKTDDISEALSESISFVLSEEGAEVALQGAFGGGIAKFTGKNLKKGYKALKETRAAVDDNKTEQLVDELHKLNKQLIGATDEDVRQGLESQIKEKSAELDGLVTKANGIVDGMTNDEIDEINNMSDLAQAQIQRVNALNAKKKAGDINNDEYLSALEGYKAEFVKAKNRIKGIVEEAADTTPEKVSQRTVKNADAINRAYAKDQGNDTFFDVVLPNMDDLLTSVVNRKFRENPEFGEQGVTKEDFKEDLIYGTERNRASSLYGLYNSFRADEGQLLTTYITNNLESRAKRIVDERLGKQATVGGVSIDTQESRQLEAEEIDIPVMQGPKFTKRLGLSDEIMNKARKAAIKALSTAKNVDDKKFVSDIVETINSEIFEDIRALVPKPKEREAFMEKFAGTVWDAMPQSSMAKATRNETFKEWSIEAPTKEAFIDYFLGRDQEGLKTSTINDRVKKQLPQYLAKAIGAEYAEDLLKNDPEVRERFKLTQKQEVEEAVSDIQKLQVAAEKDLAVEEFASNFEDARSFNKFVEKFINFVPHDNTKQVKRSNEEDAELIRSTFLRLAKEGKINPESWVAARFGNFGAVYDENGNPQPKTARGGLYYGVKDPKYLETLNEAEKNWKGERFGDPKKLGFGESNNPVEGKKINQKKFKEVTEAFNEQAKINQNLVIQATENVANLIKEGENPYIVGILLHNAYKATRGVIKASYEFKLYEGGDLEYGTEGKFTEKDAKGNTRLVVREEHSPPVKVFGAELLKAGLTVPPEKIRLRVEDMYKDAFQGLISLKYDEQIDASGFQSSIAENSIVGKNSGIIRLLEAGIPANKLFDKDGVSLVEKYGLSAEYNTPDVSKAQNDVIKEKLEDNIETLIDRAIGKLEDYLGPKGALQANFAAVPINILIGGLRATKLAYRGSKNLAKALEAGYKKVQDYMSQQEWLDFTKQAVTEVKKEPTGKTIALAIANENAIKNEQNRINKLNVLNEAQAKKIRVFDFDDTIARSNSKVLYTMPDGKKGKLNATEFAARGEELKNQGAEFDFSEFSKVVEGKPGPLFSVAQRIAKARGNEDLYILTARPADSKFAIKEFLDALGLDFKLDNIVGLGDSTAKAKADWMLQKAEKDGFNDFYFADDAIKNVKAVKEALKSIDGKVKVQQAKLAKDNKNKSSQQIDEELKKLDEQRRKEKKAEGLERNFRRILNIKKQKGKRPSKWFIPPNAEDIKGLLYAFLPNGAEGVLAKKFFNSAILKPYSDAIAAAEAEILQLSKKFVELKQNAKVKLDENIEGTPYTMGDAIKVYNWAKAGVEVDILKQEYLDRLIGAVEANPNAKYLADEVAANYDIEYDKNWRGVPFNKSIYDAINKGTRTKHLQTFSENVDVIFNKDNLQEIENAFGKPFVQALRNSLKRMQTGRNRVSTDAQSNKFLNWINRSVATTMFLNSRSAILQLLSSLNFIGQKDNNIFQATAAFANQEQWQEDYNKLWNSDYLTNRREGAKFDVLADEIAENQEGWLNKLLQKGFLPTRYADSFAIALGGAAFYRNRANALMKQGMTKEEAEAQAMKDWQQSAEETQQSSDPSKISEIQASSIGKIIYAFANTPFQYARKSKRLLQDVVSGRSKAEGGMNQIRKDLQSVFYYTVGQAMLFNALQNALFAAMFSDDEEDKLEDKTVTAIERALTSYAKSLGNPGAVVASLYSVLAEAGEQIEERGRIDNPYKLALEATAISPPLNTKLKDIVAIGNIYKYNHKQIQNDPFEAKLDNPVLEIAGNAASFTGVPLDRVIRKAQNLEAVMNEETAAWEKVFLTLGWSKWELGIDLDERSGKFDIDKGDFDIDKDDFDIETDDFDIEEGDFEIDSPINKLERGVAGKAYNDGSIEVDPNLSPVEREKTIAHEKQHVKDINAGKLDYDDNFVYWNGGKHKRENGKIEYKGKMVEEGHPSLPWEKRAYDAEPSTKEIKEKKKRTKLY